MHFEQANIFSIFSACVGAEQSSALPFKTKITFASNNVLLYEVFLNVNVLDLAACSRYASIKLLVVRYIILCVQIFSVIDSARLFSLPPAT